MSMMTKIFGQNAKGENGLFVFLNHWDNLSEQDYDYRMLLSPLAGLGLVGDWIMAGIAGAIVGAVVTGVASLATSQDALYNAWNYGAPYGASISALITIFENPAYATYQTYQEVSWLNTHQTPRP